jgi:hypothetical protein
MKKKLTRKNPKYMQINGQNPENPLILGILIQTIKDLQDEEKTHQEKSKIYADK